MMTAVVFRWKLWLVVCMERILFSAVDKLLWSLIWVWRKQSNRYSICTLHWKKATIVLAGSFFSVKTCATLKWRNNSNNNSPDTTGTIKQIETMGRSWWKDNHIILNMLGTPGLSIGPLHLILHPLLTGIVSADHHGNWVNIDGIVVKTIWCSNVILPSQRDPTMLSSCLEVGKEQKIWQR